MIQNSNFLILKLFNSEVERKSKKKKKRGI